MYSLEFSLFIRTIVQEWSGQQGESKGRITTVPETRNKGTIKKQEPQQYCDCV